MFCLQLISNIFSLLQIDARKRIDKRGAFRDVVSDVKCSHGIGKYDDDTVDEPSLDSDFPDTKLLELVLLADPAAIDEQQRCRDIHRTLLHIYHLLQLGGFWPDLISHALICCDNDNYIARDHMLLNSARQCDEWKMRLLLAHGTHRNAVDR